MCGSTTVPYAENDVAEVMELSYRFIPEPKGLVSSIDFNSFEGNQTVDSTNQKDRYIIHGTAKQTELGKVAAGFKIEQDGFYRFPHRWRTRIQPGILLVDVGKTYRQEQPVLFSARWMNQPSTADTMCGWRAANPASTSYMPGQAMRSRWSQSLHCRLNKWNHLCVTYDGSGKAAGIDIFINGASQQKDISLRTISMPPSTRIKPSGLAGATTVPLQKGVEIDEIGLYHRVLNRKDVEKLSKVDSLSPLFAKPLDALANAQRTLLHDEYLNRFDKEYKNLLAARNNKQNALNNVRKNKITSMVMGDNPPNKMRDTYLLVRGQYSSPDKSKVIQANTPDFLHPMKTESEKNRLGLAKWLTDKENPLTPRVTVNRYWQTIFGRGLCDTPSDFGSQGKWPTHPGLINWLAADFLESDWDVKKMIRQLVTSATYRQSSVTTEEHLAKDPENLYFARAPRFRMMGEFVRDQALHVSGLLNKKFGGPGVKPYQPAGLWNEVSLRPNRVFVQDKGDKIYRRSMYTYWKRSAPQPAMAAFDTPSREICTIQRQRTNTPMQSLVTLNDVQFVEASRFLAQRVLKSSPKTCPAGSTECLNWPPGDPQTTCASRS